MEKLKTKIITINYNSILIIKHYILQQCPWLNYLPRYQFRVLVISNIYFAELYKEFLVYFGNSLSTTEKKKEKTRQPR